MPTPECFKDLERQLEMLNTEGILPGWEKALQAMQEGFSGMMVTEHWPWSVVLLLTFLRPAGKM